MTFQRFFRNKKRWKIKKKTFAMRFYLK